jgi:hypothetical protein
MLGERRRSEVGEDRFREAVEEAGYTVRRSRLLVQAVCVEKGLPWPS